MRHFQSKNPHNSAILGRIAITTQDEIKETVARAREAQIPWRELGLAARVAQLRPVALALISHKDEFAKRISEEMGMPIQESASDVESASRYFMWYLDNAQKCLAPEITLENNTEVHTVYREAIGVAAVIVPWNFPASNFVWGCVQNLIAGNTVVFKCSEEVPLCGMLIEKIMKEADLPPGVFAEVYGKGPVGALLARQNVDLICFTGSSAVGKSLYRVAAAGMKRIVMELGGSAAGIVFPDADLDSAIAHIYDARFQNAGQACDALKRLLVHESVWDPTVERLAAKLQMIQLGDPLNPYHHMGPLISTMQVELLERQVLDALELGGIVIAGGKQPGLAGAYYEPTLIGTVSTDMRVWREEVFGPVLPIMRFKTEEEAIALANDTQYGLGGYVYTQDAALAARVAAQLQTGMVSVNGVSYVRPMNPFGGYKHSGVGREHGRWGFEDVTQAKIVARPKHA